MKKSISILLLLCMLIGMLGGVSAFAVDGEESIGDDIAVSDILEEAEEVIEPAAAEPAPEPEAEPAPAEEPAAEEAPAEEPEAEEIPAEEVPAEETAEEQPAAEEAPAAEEQAEEVIEDGEGYVCFLDKNNNGSYDTDETYYATVNAARYSTKGTVEPATIVMIDDAQVSKCTTFFGTGYTYPKLTLDLNGHVLSAAEGYTGNFIAVAPGATLTIQDSSAAQTGMITGGNSDYGGAIRSDGTLTINGGTISGNTATNGGGAIYSGGTLTVSGGSITGNTARSGGAIMSFGTLTINGGTISGNTATNGGAIYSDGTLTVSVGTISGNTATNGGAIYNGKVYDGTLEMTDGTVTGNTAKNGGGIYNCGTLTIKGGTISRNTAAEYGGGIYNCGTLTVSDGAISDNTAAIEGGGILNYLDATLTVSGGSISGNKATSVKGDEGRKGGFGGGVENWGTFTMSGGSISDNTARYGGGGVCSHGTLEMTGGSISGNNANGGGGVNCLAGNFTFSGGEISDNIAEGCGGGIYVGYLSAVGEETAGNFTMSGNAKLLNNTAGACGGGIGTAAYGTIKLLGGEITGNRVSVSGKANAYVGGGVEIWSPEFLVTLGGTIVLSGNTDKDGEPNNLLLADGCNATLDGLAAGASVGVNLALPADAGSEIYNFTDGRYTTNGILRDVAYFSSDIPKYKVSYNSEGYLELIEAVCFIDFDKDGVYVAGTDNYYATVQKAVNDTEDNTATNIVMIADSQENVKLAETKNITLDLNGYVITGKGNSSVIKNEGTLTIRDSNKDKQSHKFTVGENGLWTLDEDSGTESVTGGCITGGTGFTDGESYRKSGGGIYNTGTLTVTGGNIIGNQAKMNGGGIYNTGALTVTGGSITGNLAKAADGDTTHASTSGGGIYSSSQSCTISGGTVSNNSARNGGGVYANGSMTISGTAVISDNTALSGGGIINHGTLTVTGGSISGNKAISVEDDGGSIGGLGGGIYNSDNTTLNIQGGSVTGNTAEYGGGIYNTSELTMTDTAIGGTEKGAANTAIYGGGIYNNSNGKLSIKDGSISGNEAEYGGGIYNKDTLTMSGGRISGNEATKNGGGVYMQVDSTMTVGKSADVTGNTVSGEANNVYLDDSGNGAHAMMTIAAGNNTPTTMKIGVSVAENAVYSFKNPYQITTNGTADDRQYFSGDDGETIIYLAKEGGALYLQPGLEFTIEGLDDYVVGTKSEDAVVTVGCEAPENDNADDCISKDNFKCLTIGGEIVPESCFDVKDGCIILTLSKDYLNKLAVGKYTLTVTLKDTGETAPNAVYDGVELSADFNVLPIAKKQAPSTGDNNALGLWLGIAGMSVIALGAVLSMKRREN